jgi:hypothetical protein
MVSDVRKVSELHAAAADLGLEVCESYAGMVFESKKNGHGVVEVEQRSAFNWARLLMLFLHGRRSRQGILPE